MLIFVGTRSLGGGNPSRPEEIKSQYIPLKSIVRETQTGKTTFDIEEPQKSTQKTALQTFLGLLCCCSKKN